MRRFLLYLTTMGLLLHFFALPTGAYSAKYEFPDDWSRDALVFAVENGVLQGDPNGRLRPKDSITRAEMAAILVRLLGADGVADLSAFQDVDADAWYTAELSAAVEAGIFGGISATRMAPNEPLTREQAVTVLCRAFGIASQERRNSFTDTASISPYALDHVSAMAALGFVQGYADGSFRPLNRITRAEVAQLIYKLFDAIVEEPEALPEQGRVLYRGEAALPAVLRHTGDLYIGAALKEPLLCADWQIQGALRLRSTGGASLSLDGLHAWSLTCAVRGLNVSGGAQETIWLWGDEIRYRGDATYLGVFGGAVDADGCFDRVQLRSGTLTLSGTAEDITVYRACTLELHGTAQTVALPERDSTVTGSGYAQTVLAYAKHAAVSVDCGNLTDYYQMEHDSALRVVQTMRVPCQVLSDTMLYTDRNLTKSICRVPAGSTVYNEYHPDSYSIYVSLADGTKGFLPDWACRVDTTVVATDGSLNYSDAVKEGFVELNGYDSKTGYLIWVSRYTQKVMVFEGCKGNWTLIRTMDCSSGCNNTITPAGVFELSYRTTRWHFGAYYVDLVSGFNGGHAFHTVTYKPDGGYLDSRLGQALSQGCVRLMPEHAAYIYQLPMGTRVVVY